jgi:multidrug efflux pump
MSERQQALCKVILQDPAVESLSSFIGVDGTNTTLNSGRILINLKPLNQRGINATEVIRRLQPQVAKVDGVMLYMQPVQDLTVEDRVSRTQYQYTLEDPDLNELNDWTAKLVAKLQQIPELRDVATDQQNNGLASELVIDRITASRLGITPSVIDQTLYDGFGQRQVSTLYTQLNQYHLILETLPEFQKNPSKLHDIYVRSALGNSTLSTTSNSANSIITSSSNTGNSSPSPSSNPSAQTSSGSANPAAVTAVNGNAVPLSTFTHFETRSAALSVNHQGQFPVVTISFNLAPSASLGEATRAIDDAQRDIGMPLSVQAAFQGTAASFQASLQNEPILILAALVTVYIVLGVLYESFIHPITILSTLPSAGVGAILALLICGQELSVVALIGIILLIGIVKKNGIMMIDFALEAERKHGKSSEDAIYEACLLRFRPIMMTTMAALLGGLPLALGRGIGSELRRPLGIAMVGGLLLSQVLTLYTTPVIYIFFDNISKRLAGNPEPETHGHGSPESVPAD